MKKIKFILSILLSVVVLMSCEKYLDVKKSSDQRFIETAEDCQLILDDYSGMNTGYPSDAEAFADDYFINATNYSARAITQEYKDMYRYLPSSQRNLAAPQWQTPYLIVNKANLVLETLADIQGSTSKDISDPLRGAALFFRSYAFWNLAQQYAKPYSEGTAAQDPGIPIRLSSDINVVVGRGTVKEVYDRIIQDLTEAVNLLPTTSRISTRPDKAAAYAMLARTYLSMENYPQALINANAALGIQSQLVDFNSLDSLTNTPFEIFSFQNENPEILFHAVRTDQPLLNPGSASSNVAKIDSNLVKSYQTNDLRRTIFLKANGGNHAGTFRFTGNYEPVTSSRLFNGLATDEMYLIRSECYVRAGNVVSGINDLNTLLSKRWKTGTYVNISTSLTAAVALKTVLDERRKELLMRGLRWSDLRRLNRDPQFRKDVSRKVDKLEEVYTLPANDLRYVLLIPAEVITNTGVAQNPR